MTGRERLQRAISDTEAIMDQVQSLLDEREYDPYIDEGFPLYAIKGLEDIVDSLSEQVEYIENALKEELEAEEDNETNT